MHDAHKSIRNQILDNINELLCQNTDDKLKNACLKYIETFDDGELNFKSSIDLSKILTKYNHIEIVKKILSNKKYLSKKSFWILGGDGWAYDIGFGGLDHIIASGENINILVFDTEIYSNTGGQCSKSTPEHASVPFELGGKKRPKKNLAKMMMLYNNAYIAQVSLGANLQQCINALYEAEKYDGPSLIVAYSPCIGHGIKGGLTNSLESQKLAVNSGHFELFRHDPTTNTTSYDSKINKDLEFEFFENEKRFDNYLKTT